MASDAEQRWIELYIETGNALESVTTVFPDCGATAADQTKAIATRAAQLKAKHALEIDIELRKGNAGTSVEMFNIIKTLARTATQEAVKHKAAADYLDRAGYRPVNETKDLTPQHTGKELRQAAIEELTSCGISQVNAELIADGKKVKSADQADTDNPQ